MAKKKDTTLYAELLLELTDGNPPSALSDGGGEEEEKKILKNFVALLAKKRMLGSQKEIIEKYGKRYNEKHNIIEATVTLESRMSEKTRLDLREMLKKKYKAREVHMLEKVDQRVLGGLKIKIGDEIIDTTLKNTLNQLEARLTK